jgi:hypothetical protein
VLLVSLDLRLPFEWPLEWPLAYGRPFDSLGEFILFLCEVRA